MPFTFNGDWIPSKEQPLEPKGPKGPVKIRLEKRKQTVVTIISNIPLSDSEIKTLASNIKRALGCGGAVKNQTIEIQGNHVEKVQKFLHEKGIKAQCPSKKKP